MKNNTEIVPAILPEDYDEICDKVGQVKGFVKTVQIDICDGSFVPRLSWPYQNDDDGIFDRIVHEDEGLPAWQEVNYEFDLMVNWRNVNEVERWVQAGATRLIFHVESKGPLEEVIAAVTGRVEIGLALNVETDISILEKYLDKIQYVQLMGIDRIGFQGEGFDTRVVEKTASVHARFPELIIAIDGGVSPDNIHALKEAGATRFAVGSHLFAAENMLGTLRNLQNL